MDNRKILVICSEVPVNKRSGGEKVIFDYLKVLKEAGYNLLLFAENLAAPIYRKYRINDLGIDVKIGDLNELYLLLRCNHYEYCLLFFYIGGYRFIDIIKESSPQTKIILDLLDFQFIRIQREGITKRSAGIQAYSHDVFLQEVSACQKVEHVIVRSREEANALRSYVKNINIHIIPLMTNVYTEDVPFQLRENVLFVGNFKHSPNLDAFKYYTAPH